MLKDAGDGVYTMVHIDVAWFCVCASWAVQWRGMNVRFAVVVGESATILQSAPLTERPLELTAMGWAMGSGFTALVADHV